MSLIDKDKTVSAIATYLFVNDAIKGPEPRRVVDYETFARSMLKDVPEVDAIPRDYYEKVVEELCRKHTEEIASMPTIVRCKECKWADFYTTAEKEQYCYCLETDRGGRTADDFCSYGERKDNE